MVPITVEARDATTATQMLRPRASHMPGLPQGSSQASSEKWFHS